MFECLLLASDFCLSLTYDFLLKIFRFFIFFVPSSLIHVRAFSVIKTKAKRFLVAYQLSHSQIRMSVWEARAIKRKLLPQALSQTAKWHPFFSLVYLMDCSCFPRAFWLFLSVISVFPITSFLFDPKFSKRTISSIRVPIMVMRWCGRAGGEVGGGAAGVYR